MGLGSDYTIKKTQSDDFTYFVKPVSFLLFILKQSSEWTKEIKLVLDNINSSNKNYIVKIKNAVF